MRADNRDFAVAAAASLVWSNLSRSIAGTLTPAKKIAQAIIPVYGIAWNKAVITQLNRAENMDPILCKLRNPLLPRSEYERLANFLNEAFAAVGAIPPNLLRGG